MLGHPLVSDHLVSRSYLPSAAGQAAYYQAETCGGLAVCQPLTRISNHHHFQGESPAEEVITILVEEALEKNTKSKNIPRGSGRTICFNHLIFQSR